MIVRLTLGGAQMLVEIEAEEEDALREGSILDHLTSGLVAEQGEHSRRRNLV